MNAKVSEFHGASGSYAELETPSRSFGCQMLPGETARDAMARHATIMESHAADLLRRAESLRIALATIATS